MRGEERSRRRSALSYPQSSARVLTVALLGRPSKVVPPRGPASKWRSSHRVAALDVSVSLFAETEKSDAPEEPAIGQRIVAPVNSEVFTHSSTIRERYLLAYEVA